MQRTEIQGLLGQLGGVLNDNQVTTFNWVISKFSDIKTIHIQLFELLRKSQFQGSQMDHGDDRIPIKRREEKAIEKEIELRDETLDLVMKKRQLGQGIAVPRLNLSKSKKCFVPEESTLRVEPIEYVSSSEDLSIIEDEICSSEDCISMCDISLTAETPKAQAIAPRKTVDP